MLQPNASCTYGLSDVTFFGVVLYTSSKLFTHSFLIKENVVYEIHWSFYLQYKIVIICREPN